MRRTRQESGRLILPSRRSFIAGAGAGLLAAPAIVRAGSLTLMGVGKPPAGGGGGGGSPTFTQLGTATGGLQNSTAAITFAAQPLGTAGANRKLIISVGMSPQGGTVSSLTAGGNAATLISGAAGDFAQLYYLASPGGTGDIVINFTTNGIAEAAISIAEVTGVATVTNVSNSNIAFQSSPYAPAALNPMTVPATGFGVVVGVWQSTFTMNIANNDSGSLAVTTQSLTVVSGHLTASGNVTFTGASSNIGYAAATFGP